VSTRERSLLTGRLVAHDGRVGDGSLRGTRRLASDAGGGYRTLMVGNGTPGQIHLNVGFDGDFGWSMGCSNFGPEARTQRGNRTG